MKYIQRSFLYGLVKRTEAIRNTTSCKRHKVFKGVKVDGI